jgi:hypothetical protein
MSESTRDPAFVIPSDFVVGKVPSGLTWPHVSVATLVPAGVLPIAASAWT